MSGFWEDYLQKEEEKAIGVLELITDMSPDNESLYENITDLKETAGEKNGINDFEKDLLILARSKELPPNIRIGAFYLLKSINDDGIKILEDLATKTENILFKGMAQGLIKENTQTIKTNYKLTKCYFPTNN